MNKRYNEPNYSARVVVYTPGFTEKITSYDIEQSIGCRDVEFRNMALKLVRDLEEHADRTGLSYMFFGPSRPGKTWRDDCSLNADISR